MLTLNGKRIILVGTGRLLDISDFGNSRTQSFYAIADGSTMNNARDSLVRQVYSRGSNGACTLTQNTVNWVSDRGWYLGWYLDLPAGEQANTDPILTYGAVVFVGNLNGATDCSQSSYLYLIDVGSGSLTSGETTASWLIAANASSSRVITLRVIDGKIVGVTHRSDNSVFHQRLPLGKTITPAKSAWREIRR
jgi:type IV pilus assembly protein PilY1